MIKHSCFFHLNGLFQTLFPKIKIVIIKTKIILKINFWFVWICAFWKKKFEKIPWKPKLKKKQNFQHFPGIFRLSYWIFLLDHVKITIRIYAGNFNFFLTFRIFQVKNLILAKIESITLVLYENVRVCHENAKIAKYLKFSKCMPNVMLNLLHQNVFLYFVVDDFTICPCCRVFCPNRNN